MILSLENACFQYGEKPLLKQVDFILNEKQKWGVVGVNGSGKSTFLKILGGLQNLNSGKLTVLKKYRISYCPQQMDFKEGLSLYETAKQRLTGVQDYEIRTILNRLKLTDEQMHIEKMSGGQKKRLALAIALVQKADVYLLDEPTNHLDQEMILWLENYLTKLNAAIVMVTHDRYFLNRVTDHILEIDHGQLYRYIGNYKSYLEQRENRYELEKAIERKRQNFLRSEIEWIKAGAQARSTKSKSRIQRYHQIAEMEVPKQKQVVSLSSLSSRLGGKVMELQHVSKGYDSPLIQDFSDVISPTDRIGIIGNNGCGKTTLLKLILKQEKCDEGEIQIGETVRIGYFAQETNPFDESKRIIDVVKSFGEVVETIDQKKLTASQILEKFLFYKEQQYQPISLCSGGEKRRLALCCILMSAPNVLILDEPTNDLDTDTLAILEDYLEDFKGAVLAVSHDRYFIDKICDRLWVFQDQTIQNTLMDYSSYIAVSQQQQEKETTAATEKTISNRPAKSLPSMSTKEKKELAFLQENLPLWQQEIAELEKQLFLISDTNKVIEMSNLLEKRKNEFEQGSERWLELIDKQETIQTIKTHR